MTEAVISSSILIAIIILIRTVFKGKLRSSVRYALWLIAAARLMLPFSLVQSPISVMNAAETVISVNQADEIVKPTEAELYIPESVAEQTLNEASPMNVEKASPKEVRTAVRRAVTAVMLLWFCAVNVRFYLLLRKNRKAFAYDAPLRIYTTEKLASPCIFGLFRPCIYIPESSAADSEAVEYIVAHEVCHYRHGDLIWTVLRYVLPAVYWFDPFVWAAAVLSKRDCECACDEAAIKMLGEERRFRYVKAIIDLIPLKNSESLGIASTSMASGKKVLKERMKFIAARPVNKASAVIAAMAVTVLTVGSTFTSAQAAEKPIVSAETVITEADDGRITAQVTDKNGANRELVYFPAPDGFEPYIYMDEASSAKESAYSESEFARFLSEAAFSAADLSLEDESFSLNKWDNADAFSSICKALEESSFDSVYDFDRTDKTASLSLSRANGGFSSRLDIEIYKIGGSFIALMVGDDFSRLTSLVTGGILPTEEELLEAYAESSHFEAAFDGERLCNALAALADGEASYPEFGTDSFSAEISEKLDVIGKIPQGYVQCELRNIVFAVPSDGSLNRIGGSVLWQNGNGNFSISEGRKAVPDNAEKTVGTFGENACELYVGAENAVLFFSDGEGKSYSASAGYSSDTEKDTALKILGSIYLK